MAAVLAISVLIAGSQSQAASPRDFKAEYDKGAAAFGAGDYAAAKAHFERAYEIKPHPLCLFNIGQANRKLEHHDEAIAAYERYLATKPSPDLRAETEGYIAEVRKSREARAASDEARRLFLAGDYAGAVIQYEKAYAIGPEPSLLYSIGLSYDRAGDKPRAIEYYERFLKGATAPTLKVEAEAAILRLRSEPDAPVGTTARVSADPPAAGTLEPASGLSADPAPSLDPVADPGVPASARRSKLGVWAGVAGGFAAVAGGLAVVLVVLLRPHAALRVAGDYPERVWDLRGAGE